MLKRSAGCDVLGARYPVQNLAQRSIKGRR